jgi:surfeit locus 1 family protein
MNLRRAVALILGVLLFAGFTGLGVWQLERLAWKRALIARVDARVNAAALPPPGPAAWAGVSAARDEYRHVRIAGVFENDKETLVQAVTVVGPGFWVMTPLRTDDGQVVVVNRGFVPTEKAAQATRLSGLTTGRTTVTGLLRISEPHGGFLRANQPAAGRWYSRDVAAIARARGLPQAAPYFIDADASLNAGGWPRGGLTVIRFRNSHLSYALTWFGLAAMVALWGAWPLLEAARSRRRTTGGNLAAAYRPQG